MGYPPLGYPPGIPSYRIIISGISYCVILFSGVLSSGKISSGMVSPWNTLLYTLPSDNSIWDVFLWDIFP